MNGDPDAGRPVRTRPRRRVLCSAAAVVLWAAPTGAVERLPADVVPLHYQLTLTPELGLNSFEGNLTVDVEVRSPTSTITLNAVDLEIYDATIALPYGRTVRPAVSSDRRQETLTLTVPTRLPAGMMKLHIEFGGRLALDLHGFSQHRANGRKYAFTRFGPTDARRAFPCFDEPGFTASFAISAIVDDRDTAVSNGKLISDTPGPRSFKHTLRFGTTRKMSPHQAALAVGDFGCLEGSAEATPIRVCAMPDRKALGRFALDAAENGLRFYDRYFALRYPFGKLDLVALPGFAADASGSPGAAFFPEEDLLLDDSSAPTDVQTRVALSVSHALARQWFGGVVSTAWWDEVWLQDGLATWIQSKPFVAWKPQWHPELMDVQMSGRVMDVDALRAARAVRAAVTTPDDIGDALDAQAIAKTASVLRMIEAYVGAETFRSGVNAYVRAHAYGRSAASEFWTEIAQASARAVDGLVSAYVDQPGVPLVSIDGRCEGPDRTIATLVQ